MSSQRHHARFGADQLACIASYFSSASQRRQQQPHGRLPLAWVAASPSARLVAEQRNAWVVLPFDSTVLAGNPYALDENEDNAFGVALANATTPLFILNEALGLGAAADGCKGGAPTTAELSDKPASPTSTSAKAVSWISQATESLADVNHAAAPVKTQKPAFWGTSRAKPPAQKSTRPSTGVRGSRVEDPLEEAHSCGVHVGGLTTVLISGVHLYEKSLLTKSRASRPSQDSAPKQPTNASPHTSKQRINPSATLLFPSTTCCGGSVSSLLAVPPNAAVYDAILTDGAGPDSLTASQVNRSNLFRDGAELHEDDGGAEDETAHDPQTAASVYTVQQVNKLHRQVRDGDVADAFTTVWYRHVFVDAEEVTANVLCGVSQWWLQRPVRVHELPTTKVSNLQQQHRDEAAAQPSLLKAPALYVKFVVDIGADLWWPHRLLSVVRHRFAEHRWHSVALVRWVVLLWLLLSVVLESVVHGVPKIPTRHAASAQQDAADLVASFYRMGETYGGQDQLAALDVSHTSTRGVHLLACALGKVLGACTGIVREEKDARLSSRPDHFGALDVAGCIQLHHRQGEMHLLAAHLKALRECSAKQARAAPSAAPSCPLPLVNLLMMLSLDDVKVRATRSTTGLALALLSHHGDLTWISGAGCSLDNAALHELGKYALLVEAVTATQPLHCGSAATHRPSACSICAMDLTSALSLDDLNPVAYLPQLEQLLVPFTYVIDDGVARLDGHTYPQDLRDFLALCPEEKMSTLEEPTQAVVREGMQALQQLTTVSSDSTASSRAPNTSRKASRGDSRASNPAVEALHQRFRSHLYQVDFTYCSFLSSVNGLVNQQRLELLNLSQTRINKDGMFANAEKTRPSSTAHTPSPPLRLFVAEMCAHLSDLGGLAHLSTLECIVVRSGSLGDDGLRSVCTKRMDRLQLLDLSYCDRLHHVSCLASLPALETLILDSSDVTPAEVRQLRQSRSLKTLSVRFCTGFAFIGKDKAELEEVLGKFPCLQHYVYEDLVGDDELRKKKTS
ncbi:hypothetical protein ABB37_03232 [Leptomonas pyrrhocoris]|uniref:Leucine-rich repeat protein n=1 Tax=Leptomonas pyrrhocoris TaxID=157538 RepID=A0A0N0VFX0_LEPPY|nr:hypothetical protein ABB37_03232 [Leptomonas pyrrhocoris]KPA82074.1 hypothetical protein ABB37_03232 [Leptomonas pyrrhocoris]|eukprot:XP_015660513.1 hypothetical protein ABB37_03232 [Leptomonas pyrrhocoris]